jgi:hypothetical protein
MRTTIIMLLLLWSAAAARAQETAPLPGALWQDLEDLTVRSRSQQRPALPQDFRLLRLDLAGMAQLLASAPSEDAALRHSPVLLEVPLPEGGARRFRIRQASVMHPDLARKFPAIRSYEGEGIERPGERLFFAFSPLGFHALLLLEDTRSVVIRTVELGETEYYLCYYEADFDPGHEGCSAPLRQRFQPLPELSGRAAGDCLRRTYRLAMPANAEYTAALADAADPTGVNNTMATINNLVTTVSGVFQVELGIRLQLVANNNLLIFTDPVADGYTDGDQNAMAGENQGIVDGIIGSANYDLSHALGTNPGATGSSGVSQGIGTVCNNANKARGATIIGNPANPPVNLIIHELGHHFGANHTFNDNTQPICTNAGQLNAATAFEPGSGSTLMSYAGTCGTSNVQGGRDRYFHAISLQEMANYVTMGGGGCVAAGFTGNNQPTVNAGPDFTIPVSTPFMLTATGNDPDGDALTYCWEQMNNEIAPNPPLGLWPSGPNFRSLLPDPSPTRFFPNLPAVLAGTATVWEVLPSVSRTMNFRVTIRDNIANNGCTDEDDMTVTFDDSAGPFTVSLPVGDACLFAEETTTVSWNVAGTDQAPVNSAEVDILLSLDGGLSFPIVLAANTPNDGSEEVLLPAVRTENARIMVKGSNNIFFNVNPGEFTIDCMVELIVAETPVSGVYKARERIATMGEIEVAGSASFLAGEEILLNPGFKAPLGTEFLARIQPCDPCEVLPLLAPPLTELAQPRLVFLPPAEALAPGAELPTAESAGFRLYPNPFRSTFVVEVELPAPGTLYLEILDLNGRQVRLSHQTGPLDAGWQRLELDGERLPAGLYLCRAVAAGRAWQAKLVKVW